LRRRGQRLILLQRKKAKRFVRASIRAQSKKTANSLTKISAHAAKTDKTKLIKWVLFIPFACLNFYLLEIISNISIFMTILILAVSLFVIKK
jgi:hypothetical protein